MYPSRSGSAVNFSTSALNQLQQVWAEQPGGSTTATYAYIEDWPPFPEVGSTVVDLGGGNIITPANHAGPDGTHSDGQPIAAAIAPDGNDFTRAITEVDLGDSNILGGIWCPFMRALGGVTTSGGQDISSVIETFVSNTNEERAVSFLPGLQGTFRTTLG